MIVIKENECLAIICEKEISKTTYDTLLEYPYDEIWVSKEIKLQDNVESPIVVIQRSPNDKDVRSFVITQQGEIARVEQISAMVMYYFAFTRVSANLDAICELLEKTLCYLNAKYGAWVYGETIAYYIGGRKDDKLHIPSTTELFHILGLVYENVDLLLSPSPYRNEPNHVIFHRNATINVVSEYTVCDKPMTEEEWLDIAVNFYDDDDDNDNSF